MSQTVLVSSPEQFTSILSNSTVVVADFYADWCGPCKAMAPLYEQLSSQLSRPKKITFTKINTDEQQQLARAYSVTALPTFMIFKHARATQTIRGNDAKKLSEAIKKLAAEANAAGDSSGNGEPASEGNNYWLGASLAKGYNDVTEQVDIKDLELLNWDSDFAGVRTLFDATRPSAADTKGKGSGTGEKDWVESDTDEQLMLYVPLQSTLKVHSIHITSWPPAGGDGDEAPMRPETLKIYSNRAHVLGFEEAEDIPPTQEITLNESDWDVETGTAKIELRFVKFQNVSSLVIFVVDGDGDGEKVRLDRVRLVGEMLQKKNLGKLEKVGDED